MLKKVIHLKEMLLCNKSGNIKITLCFIYSTYIGIWFCDMGSAQPCGH